MSGITTHILDTSRGKPAQGVDVTLELQDSDGRWAALGTGTTNEDGRIGDLTKVRLRPGLYRLTFATGPYFRRFGVQAFYPEVQIQFEVSSAEQHYHVPLLLNPFGYSTYRGS